MRSFLFSITLIIIITNIWLWWHLVNHTTKTSTIAITHTCIRFKIISIIIMYCNWIWNSKTTDDTQQTNNVENVQFIIHIYNSDNIICVRWQRQSWYIRSYNIQYITMDHFEIYVHGIYLNIWWMSICIGLDWFGLSV